MGLAINLVFKQRVRYGVGASEEVLPFGAVELDASLEEGHSASNSITSYPVETGVDITDHVRKEPDRLTIRGIVSEHPIGLGGARGLLARAQNAYQKTLLMLEQAELISVVTTLRQYDNMVIESMEVPRDSARGHVVEMTLQLREIQTAEVASTAGTIDLGTQPTTVVS